MAKVPDGYERLLHDVFVNDSTNFTHWSELKRYWEFIEAVEDAWQKKTKQAIQKLRNTCHIEWVQRKQTISLNHQLNIGFMNKENLLPQMTSIAGLFIWIWMLLRFSGN